MKKNILFIGISVSLLILLGIGVSYSMWNMSNMQDTENVISTTECFDISITSEENSISLKNSYPISDEKGKNLTPFTFKVTNTCDMAASYSINLESLKGSTLTSQFLKVMVNNKVPKMLNQYDSVSTVNNGSIEARVLDTGTLFKNKSKEYQVRLWIDYDTTMEDLDNETKVLKSKIVVMGVPSNKEAPLLTNKITELSSTDTTNFATDDPDSNIRYIGKNPDNYVYFNCSDYNNQSDNTCEKWRIIGVFNNVTKSDGTKENLVKIIRNESIGNYSWDNKDTTTGAETDYGKNDWSTARLNYLLNSGHDSESVGGSLYWNAKSGTCYYGSKNATTSCDFTSTGLKNDTTRNAIEEVVWSLGGNANYDDTKVASLYKSEKNTFKYNDRLKSWIGKIGLIYSSDYGYATSGGVKINRTTCLSYNLKEWNSSEDCYYYNYLYNSNRSVWTMTPSFSGKVDVFRIEIDGSSYIGHSAAARDIYPTLYLKSNITVTKGDGSSTNPYQLDL